MKTNMKSWMKAIFTCCALLVAAACDDSDKVMGTGEVQFEITDAPSDDVNISGVYVTVADIRVNGKSIEGFSGKQTINLKAYQEGSTKLLGTARLDATSYSNIVLVLDLNTDENGNSPGCYVRTVDNTKYKLASTASGQMEVALNKAWTVKRDAQNKVIMDVDIRKAVQYSSDDAVRYTFVSMANLQNSIRVVTSDKTGMIRGSFEGNYDSNQKQVIVYAYKKGTFNASTETQSENGIVFRNAVNSAMVKSGITGKTYTLAFMEEGDYELVFATFTKDTSNGRYSFSTILDADADASASLTKLVQVKAGVELSVSITINGSI
jgi:hypothetical protein